MPQLQSVTVAISEELHSLIDDLLRERPHLISAASASCVCGSTLMFMRLSVDRLDVILFANVADPPCQGPVWPRINAEGYGVKKTLSRADCRGHMHCNAAIGVCSLHDR